jgi:serine-type D-Ala-D-Ala carboxypeptidase/endopeptidase
MDRRDISRAIASFVILAAGGMAQTNTTTGIPSDSEIRKILEQRIDTEHQSVGIAVGVIEPAGRRVITYGSLEKGDQRPLTGDTVFEIGSITKVFTSLLLAEMVQRGEVALTDPAAKYLPATVKMPERGGRSITLEDLSTHTSGLPRLPSNLDPKDPANPYADYSVDQLYRFLSTYTLPRDIGSKYEYSNLGGGLLGHVLARRAGTGYEALVRTRILEPLHMSSTTITLSPEMQQRMAVGYNAALEPVPNWDLPTLAGAGALRSTANDMLTFLAAELGYTQTALAPAMAAMLAVRRPAGTPGLDVGLGWHILTGKSDGREIVCHDGGTGGFRSFLAFDRKQRAGVVVLSNAQTAAGVDDLGLHLLDAQVPLVKPPKQRTEVTVDPKIFDGYIGQYQMAPNVTLSVTREGPQLFVQLPGQPKFEIFAESERDYFLKLVDAQVTFETDSNGRATAVVLHQMGRDLKGARNPQ